MAERFKRDDLRVQKTQKAITTALITLLERSRFSKITVHHICDEAQVSRTAFYSHYRDKYDLLEKCLQPVRDQIITMFYENENNSEELENYTCWLICQNSSIVTNLMEGDDQEMFLLLLRFFEPHEDHFQSDDKRRQCFFRITKNFLAGGLFHVVLNRMRETSRLDEEAMRSDVAYVFRLFHLVLEGAEACEP